MCNLIARFWDVNAGKITIGGTDIRDFKLDSLMKNISMVFQSVYLFADTIENNIKFGCPDATHEQVVEAAKKACCHDFISALPDGYDTVIGEGGGTLSGGEKQRISIARAMLKDAPIIILDEATSSVDPENEDELQMEGLNAYDREDSFKRVEKLSDSLCFPFPEKASLWDSCLRRAEALCRLEEDGGEKLPSSPVQKY